MKRNFVEFFRAAESGPNASLVLYYAGQEKCLPGHKFGPAVRGHYLLHFILSGHGEFHINSQIYHLGSNQAFIIQPGESTYYLADQQDPWEYLWFGFDGQDVPLILQDCGLLGDLPYANYVQDKQLLDTFSSVINRLKRKEENEYFLMGDLFHIFGHLCRTNGASHHTSSNLCLQHALNFIRNNYRHDIKVQDIAQYAQVDRSYLYRLFMEEFHISPKQYLIRQRLQCAMDLLAHSNLNTTEIAYASGFADPSAFCSHFRRLTGFTPKHYRSIDGKKTLSYVSNHLFPLPDANDNDEKVI